MSDIAKHTGAGQPVSLRDVASRQRLPKLYLSQLALPLKAAGMVRSVSGNKGGFLLGRDPAHIRLIDIVEAVDGPVGILDCVMDPNYCDRTKECECWGVYSVINRQIVSILSGTTLEDVMRPDPPRPAVELHEVSCCAH